MQGHVKDHRDAATTTVARGNRGPSARKRKYPL
jgi:hypothetical protein